jgi:hypothetical protein
MRTTEQKLALLLERGEVRLSKPQGEYCCLFERQEYAFPYSDSCRGATLAEAVDKVVERYMKQCSALHEIKTSEAVRYMTEHDAFKEDQ